MLAVKCTSGAGSLRRLAEALVQALSHFDLEACC